ncbi:MAG: hypothetical protein EBZ59_04725 [Planctomycetia bacterium]|nr:hypothetical protein [Planctomycetia bacterium]
MRITYACPACGTTATRDGVESARSLECPACRATLPVPEGAVVGAGPAARLRRCLVCPSSELFVRKDFPQRVGLGIVVAGLAASCIAWGRRELVTTFAILFATALLDLVLYLFMPVCLSCYRCGARYRGEGVADDFEGFNLETHEKHRQSQARTQGLGTPQSGGPVG